jgi:hypothetical protein
MSTVQRVTLTLPADVLVKARELSQGNLSQFVTNILSEYIERVRLERLRDALIAGCIANAEDDLVIAEEFRYADYEVTMKYVPPSPELEVEDAGELSPTR